MPKWLKAVLCVVLWPVGVPVLIWQNSRLGTGIKAIIIAGWALASLAIIATAPPALPSSAKRPSSVKITYRSFPAAATPPPVSKSHPVHTAVMRESDAERRYFKAVSDGTDSLTEGLKKLTEQSGSAAEAPAMIDSYDWKIGTVGALAMLTVGADQVGKIAHVPPQDSDIDRRLKGIARQTRALVTDFARGVDHKDAALIGRANVRIVDIGRRCEETDPLIQRRAAAVGMAGGDE